SVADPGFVVAEGQAGVTTTTTPPPTTTTTISTVTTTTLAPAVDSWPRRFFDAQNTANVGDDPKLTPANAPDLTLLATLSADGPPLYSGLKRVDKTLWCLNVDKIAADRSATPSGALCEDNCECNVNGDCPADPPGCTRDAPSACQAYFCDGPWPMSLGSPEPP